MTKKTAEQLRLETQFPEGEGWKKWGPYLSERQWGTVREDYSPHGNAWDYFPHDHARSRAYRWGEDGIAGLSDSQQRLCLSLAMWNTRDPILKERLFGLTNGEGNHGEDVKELYYYLDATPTHSYLKMLYKYPQREYPYGHLVEENRRRGIAQPEYELADTELFEANRYFDVFVEYAQAGVDDILMRITVENRGPEPAPIHLLPQLWFRNTWSWKPNRRKPTLRLQGPSTIQAEHSKLGTFFLYANGSPTEFLFCDNESNASRLWNDSSRSGFWKDAFHERVIDGRADAVSPDQSGTKAAVWYSMRVRAGGRAQVELRLTKRASEAPFADFDALFAARVREADEFYAHIQQGIDSADARSVQRQAFAGMIWSKQFFYFDIPEWLAGDPTQPAPPTGRRQGRNRDWAHLNNADIISMPDKWEYPWYAAWDLAFHCIPLAHLDARFAKEQLVLLTREWYMHPNGQMPAYEWAFGDVNPPVHAWAAWRVFQIDRKQRGDHGDLEFLERILHKLMLNFTWWVNRKDAEGRNVFQGGFLGLDNIGVFDRSSQLPTGGHIDQADGTSWMAMYALNLMRIALELAQHNRVYEDIATKFFEHFLHIAEAMSHIGGDDGGGVGLWDEQDEFFYDVLHLPDGRMQSLKIRSMVGLIPLFAVETLEPELLDKVPDFKRRLEWFLKNRPDLASLVSHWNEEGRGHRRLLSLLRGHRMKRLLKRMLDETEFLSQYGIRALSRVHERTPYVYRHDGMDLSVRYQPAESDSGLFGGNSNWRGPIWFPVNFLIIESLQKFHHYYGDDFKVECPTGSGNFVTLNEAANEVATRLTRIFLTDSSGGRPEFAHHPRLQTDPHFRDHVLFYEYFHGDSGRGVGASHQTGWTGLVAKLLMPRYAHTELKP
ncbi:MAG: MGH1-like glycoside hydrolase domain-containing protein [Steroidobacteraceae bacterium]